MTEDSEALDAIAEDLGADAEASTHDRDADGMDDRLEMVLTGVFAMVAASVARKVAGEVWKATTGRTPPTNAKDGKTDLKVIILWGAVAGAAAGVARAVAERQAVRVVQSRHSS